MLQSKINIGELDRQLTIIQPVYATGVDRPSTNEDKITGWTELATVWAKVRNFKGNEAMIAEKLTETHHIEAVIRRRTDLKTEMRVGFETRVYGIVSINEADDRRIMTGIVAELIDDVLLSELVT